MSILAQVPTNDAHPQLVMVTLKKRQKRQGPGLNIVLVSRENPEWMVVRLSKFPRIDATRKFSAVRRSTSRAVRGPPTLASIAASLIHKQRLERPRKDNQVSRQQHSSDATHYVDNRVTLTPLSSSTGNT
jgi:hypothetical protein